MHQQSNRLSSVDVGERLAGQGIGLDFGAASARIRGNVRGLAEAIAYVYGAFCHEDSNAFFDITAQVVPARGIRRYFKPQVKLIVDGEIVFAPFPADTHLPLLEWGMNFYLAQRLGFRLLLHAGVVERNGRAAILAALPGSGKSTLTAALSLRGFRLFSDEFGVVSLEDGNVIPLLRPIALKNESIDVIARFAPEAVIGPRYPKTRKGTVAHLAADAATVARRHEPARPALIIFPRFNPAVHLELQPEKAARAFSRLAVNSFNYEMLGPAAFDAVGRLVEHCPAWNLVYSDLERAIEAIDRLLDQPIH